jgi:phage-related protein
LLSTDVNEELEGLQRGALLEVVEDDDGNTHRAVYTVKFAGVVYVLHAFQKKSKSGIKTPPEEIEKLKSRLREAEKDYAEWTEQQKRKDQDHH